MVLVQEIKSHYTIHLTLSRVFNTSEHFTFTEPSALADPKGLYYGVEAPSLWKPPPA